MHFAADGGNKNAIDLFVQSVVDINIKNDIDLHVATLNGHLDVVNYVIDLNIDKNLKSLLASNIAVEEV